MAGAMPKWRQYPDRFSSVLMCLLLGYRLGERALASALRERPGAQRFIFLSSLHGLAAPWVDGNAVRIRLLWRTSFAGALRVSSWNTRYSLWSRGSRAVVCLFHPSCSAA